LLYYGGWRSNQAELSSKQTPASFPGTQYKKFSVPNK